MKANESRTKYEEELRIWKEHQPVLPKKALSPYNIFVKELFMSGALDGEVEIYLQDPRMNLG